MIFDNVDDPTIFQTSLTRTIYRFVTNNAEHGSTKSHSRLLQCCNCMFSALLQLDRIYSFFSWLVGSLFLSSPLGKQKAPHHGADSDT